MWVANADYPPVLIGTYHAPETDAAPCSNFLKLVDWSPDGSVLLTLADDSSFRLFSPNGWGGGGGTDTAPSSVLSPHPYLTVPGGECAYGAAWHPGAASGGPTPFVFAMCSRSQPAHLVNATSGERCGTYRAHNAQDDPTTAFSVAFDAGGSKLISGHEGGVRVFEVGRPGRECWAINLDGQGGGPVTDERPAGARSSVGEDGGGSRRLGRSPVSSLASSGHNPEILAAGTFAGPVALLDLRANSPAALLEGHTTGVTHLAFGADGSFLYSGARNDASILCWDARMLSGCVYSIDREAGQSGGPAPPAPPAESGGVGRAGAADLHQPIAPRYRTNQRMAFSVEPCGRHLAAGGLDGRVRLFDLRTGLLAGSFRVAADPVAACTWHPTLPILATGSGTRRFDLAPGSDDDEACERGTSSGSAPGTSPGPGLAPESRSAPRPALALPREARARPDGRRPWGRADRSLGADENALSLWTVGIDVLEESGAGAPEAG